MLLPERGCSDLLFGTPRREGEEQLHISPPCNQYNRSRGKTYLPISPQLYCFWLNLVYHITAYFVMLYELPSFSFLRITLSNNLSGDDESNGEGTVEGGEVAVYPERVQEYQRFQDG